MQQAFEVRVPPAIAFEFFSDPNHAFQRLAPQHRVTWDGPIRPGARFRLDSPNPADRCDGEVHIYEPPHRVSYRVWLRDRPDREGTAIIRFEPTADGTLVSGVMTASMSRLLELAARLLKPALAIQARRGTRRLIRMLESEYQARSA
jgi:uncharacterized protein YndB with AHSA1/START domain